ncbi:MAG: 16S rRNA (cytosine(1402)-N(4))-methyltransferase RsmH [Gammaproteobacteria bacterium]|nr:16S rRNA (cytosine(1402)-N(4))-methyltransferase RsmH [Gammaproteobacteria bacterium]
MEASGNKDFRHASVLLSESVNALQIRPEGVYVDCTFGRGGHSAAILEQLNDAGRLLAIDKDVSALESAQCQQLLDDNRFQIEHGSFANLKNYIEKRQWMGGVDGILMDLGVSSPQLDNANRGFSFIQDGPLDLRMDQTQHLSAKDWLAKVSEDELKIVLRELGEERFAGRIAKAIIARRVQSPIETTLQLSSLIEDVAPVRERNKHPATRTFLALRLKINGELDDLQSCLPQAVNALSNGGRLVVISFHSLEDRIVKRFIRDQSRPGDCDLMGRKTDDTAPGLKKVGKIIKASRTEINVNRRSRSAVLRVAEKL